MVFLKKIKAKLEDFLQLEEEWKACRKHTLDLWATLWSV